MANTAPYWNSARSRDPRAFTGSLVFDRHRHDATHEAASQPVEPPHAPAARKSRRPKT